MKNTASVPPDVMSRLDSQEHTTPPAIKETPEAAPVDVPEIRNLKSPVPLRR